MIFSTEKEGKVAVEEGKKRLSTYSVSEKNAFHPGFILVSQRVLF